MPKSFKPKKEENDETQPEAGTESERQLQDFEQSYPVQLQLFEYIQPKERHYSNTVELYDFMPKYHWGKSERINGKFLESLEREFECRGVKCESVVENEQIENNCKFSPTV